MHGENLILILHADINECTNGTSECEQVCNNTLASYVCSCYNGYKLTEDGHSCVGKQTSLIVDNTLPC